MKNITTKISKKIDNCNSCWNIYCYISFIYYRRIAQPPIRVGEDPFGIAYDPVNKRMYVTNIRDDTVSVINTATNTVINRFIFRR